MARKNRRDRKRDKYTCAERFVLNVTACNFDHDHGEAGTSFFMIGARSGDVEAVTLNLADSRKLAVGLLVSLYTADDEFAARILEEHFPYDEKGNYHWPVKES